MSLRVLLVDGDYDREVPASIEHIAEHIRQACDAEVDQVDLAEDGEALLAEHDYDVLVLEPFGPVRGQLHGEMIAPQRVNIVHVAKERGIPVVMVSSPGMFRYLKDAGIYMGEHYQGLRVKWYVPNALSDEILRVTASAPSE